MKKAAKPQTWLIEQDLKVQSFKYDTRMNSLQRDGQRNVMLHSL